MGIQSRKEGRLRCRQCHKTFAATTGTAWYRLRTAAQEVQVVITWLAHGCPRQASVAAYGVDERTVANWLARAGQQSQAVHEHLVEQPRDLGQGQADELRGKRPGGVGWRALALMVSTRLWLGGVVSERRDLSLLRALRARVRRCALARTLLFCPEGLCAYVRALRETLREPLPTGKPGRPRWQAWKNILIAQVIKRYAQRRVVAVTRRIVQGTRRQVDAVRRRSHGQGVINTAYSERLNATLRERWAPLVRRGRALARRTLTREHGRYLRERLQLLLSARPPALCGSGSGQAGVHARDGRGDYGALLDHPRTAVVSCPPHHGGRRPSGADARRGPCNRQLSSGAHDHG